MTYPRGMLLRAAPAFALAVLSVACGGPKDPPVTLGTERLGAPQWEPADYHQFSADLSGGAVGVLADLLPEPTHALHPELGVGPGVAHDGPYDHELDDGVRALGLVEHTTFSLAEGSAPNGIVSTWMMLPTADAPLGSSPDGGAVPILPNAIFPIHVQIDAYSGDAPLSAYTHEFDVPALDAKLNPPFAVEGYSHLPMITASYLGGLPSVPGTLETHVRMTDAAGDGWELTLTYQAVK